MRKQTKLVAVLSAAALLAMGASMTSFAAGWQKDDAGVWHYYDSDDDMVTDEWKKDGGKWFHLDDDGDMETSAWVDEYYVGEDGAMLVNQWIKTTADEDTDDPTEDGDDWYYFDSKGKRVENKSKKINGQTYFFDTDGKMQYGWYEDPNSNGNVYYLGDEDDGARKSGWLWLAKPDEDADEDGEKAAAIELGDGADDEAWYWFGTNGKVYRDAKEKTINGRKYYFASTGQMLYEWINGVKRTTASPSSNAYLDATSANADADDVRYMNVVEEGWRADGWYEIDGSEALGAEGDTDWYYFKDGKAKKADKTKASDDNGAAKNDDKYRAKIKINGKNFCFNEIGQMQTGLQKIGDAFYYFDDNGYMKTGKVSVEEDDGDTYTYYFETKNGDNGKGVTGEKSGYLYFNGKRLEADDDYKLYTVKGNYYLVNKNGKLQKSTGKAYKVENFDGEEKTFSNIDSKSYKISGLSDELKAAATRPEITLYETSNGDDQVWTDNGNGKATWKN